MRGDCGRRMGGPPGCGARMGGVRVPRAAASVVLGGGGVTNEGEKT
jgi:hypothetical protein